ncbi:MAG: hypothetical protein ACHQAY_15300 [Hyphomicrobiales bacterium]
MRSPPTLVTVLIIHEETPIFEGDYPVSEKEDLSTAVSDAFDRARHAYPDIKLLDCDWRIVPKVSP